jgi:hypothetical protein
MAQSSRYYRIDNDVLLEFIYHDQANPSQYHIEVDDNGTEVMFLDTVAGDPFSTRHLIAELGGDVVNFDVTQSGGYLAVENFAARTLLLQNGKTYKFNLSALVDPSLFQITGTLGIWSYSPATGIGVFVPNQNGTVQYTYPGLIGGKINVASKANPLFANPDENTGNDINQTLGRYHAVPASNVDKTKYALIGYDSVGAYDKFNYINDALIWGGSNENDLIANQADNTLNINYIKYDSIRLHLRSGYSFATRGYSGFLFEVTVDRNSGAKNYLTQLVYLNSSNYEIANPKPFILGETLYSKFIEVKIPTVVSQNTEFLDRFYGDNTPASSDLVIDTNYGINFKLINKLQNEGGYDYFYTGEENILTISREDEYQDFTVAVEKATDGDYFKIFGARNGTIEDFEAYILNRVNLTSDDIIVLYDVEVFEQLGNGDTEVKTFSTTYSQYEDFSQPIVFRPVIMNANIAINFSIDVTMRIYNQTDNTQIVKTGSLTTSEAAKYGKKIMNVKIVGNTMTEVFNTLPNLSATRAVKEVLNNAAPRSIKTIPAFVERYNVVAASSTVEFLTTPEGDVEVVEVDTKPYVNESDLQIYVPPFSAYFKFKVAKKRGDDVVNLAFDNAENIVLSFVDGKNKLKFNHMTDKTVNMGDGEVLFFINEANATSIRGMSSDQFYLSVDNGKTETMILKGKFTK